MFHINDWIIDSKKQPISNAQEINLALDTLSSKTPSLKTLPEMFFGSNYLTLKFFNFELSFKPIDALMLVEVGINSKRFNTIKVAASKSWNHKSSPINYPFDWTYYSPYCGTFSAQVSPTFLSIPYDKLKILQDVLFFDEIVLYEDELGDNGVSKFSVRIVPFN